MPEKSKGTEDLLSHAVAVFDQVAKGCGVAYLLVGAYARDLFLRDIEGVRLPRRTNDVDFAVMVGSWEEFVALRKSLLQTTHFAPVLLSGSEVLHKLMFHGILEIDFIPFGELAPKGSLRCWPEEFHQQMDVSGMLDAFASAQIVDVGGCQVASITAEAFVILKLLAWNDRPDREKDAKDLAYVFREYESLPGKMDALWAPENFDLTELLNDHGRRVVRLLGRQLAQCFSVEINIKACEILTRESEGSSLQLAQQMSPLYTVENAMEALSDLREGIMDMVNGICEK